MSVQPISQSATVERDPAHTWGMALYSFMTSTETICELAKAQPYRDMAVEDLDKIASAALAINLMWAQLKARRAA